VSNRFSKAGIELGIVTAQGEAMLAFYRDTLGLEPEVPLALPDGGLMHRLRCGASIVKIVCPATNKPTEGIASTASGAPVTTIPAVMDLCNLVRGFRMVTILVNDLDEALGRCVHDNARVICSPMDSRRESATGAQQPVRWVVVEDPDGNWVEFVELMDMDADEETLPTTMAQRVDAES
jgi:catechol 2,3-dioxygenase-like lactoylglutathione lyase family enzyme